ncbi:protein ENHANCED DISEASE RESISTANCE 2 [Sesamum angolense]|uniref:Protein ENHANCED DISEASE RESISTANCE 2 n=1 Tax=Sesamum angolense TaxID=2727404 RepID=A0AAE1X2T2_9LAMI|nr:protein ENHANCED DISEASE RESISTANCE 2 [Sesamum angolense]
MAEIERKMNGWLYLMRHNRFGLQYSRKRYFTLEDNCLKSFKSIPASETEEPVRSAIIDSCIRVVDNGRETHHRKLFFTFTLYNTSNHNDRLKDTALNPGKDLMSDSIRKWQPFRIASLQRSKRQRFQREALDDHPAIMAVGTIDASSEAVFRTLMSLGTSRTEWDFCFYRGSVVENLDGHTDIIHIQLYNHWLPWAMKRRDLLLRRYWRREEDGTYVILYHSVVHRKCPPQDGYIRACLKSGGYLITPMQQGKECVIKHMLAVDWKVWRSYLKKESARSITIRMLGKVAALRELFKANAGNTSPEYITGERKIDMMRNHESGKQEINRMHNEPEDEVMRLQTVSSSLTALSDAADEFFDVPEPSDDEALENGWNSEMSPEISYLDNSQPKLSSAANFVKKLHDLAVPKKGYTDLQDISREEAVSPCYGCTLPKDSSFNMPCSWATADPSSFLVRGPNYLVDNQKSYRFLAVDYILNFDSEKLFASQVKAKGTLLQMVGADWLRSEKREDDIAGRYGSIVQKYAVCGGSEFFFVINIQVPGTSTYHLALYYMLKSPLEETPLLERFVNGDDAFRNSRFKLIPYISKGSWIVKQSVGKKSCLIGQALEVNYFQGKNYLELDIDVGSSTVARGVVSLVLGYLNNLVIEMAFLIQGNTADELPEFLLGTCRLNNLDVLKSVCTDSMRMS